MIGSFYMDWRPVGSYSMDPYELDILHFDFDNVESRKKFSEKIAISNVVDWDVLFSIVKEFYVVDRVDGVFCFYVIARDPGKIFENGLSGDTLAAISVSYYFKCYRGHTHTHHAPVFQKNEPNSNFTIEHHFPVKIRVEHQKNGFSAPIRRKFDNFGVIGPEKSTKEMEYLISSDVEEFLTKVVSDEKYLISLISDASNSPERSKMRAILRIREGFASRFDRTMRHVSIISSDKITAEDYKTCAFGLIFAVLIFQSLLLFYGSHNKILTMIWIVFAFTFIVVPIFFGVMPIGNKFVGVLRKIFGNEVTMLERETYSLPYKIFGHKAFDVIIRSMTIFCALSFFGEFVLEFVGTGVPSFFSRYSFSDFSIEVLRNNYNILVKNKDNSIYVLGISYRYILFGLPIFIVMFTWFYCVLGPAIARSYARLEAWRKCEYYCIFGDIYSKVCIRMIQKATPGSGMMFFNGNFDSIALISKKKKNAEYVNIVKTIFVSLIFISFIYGIISLLL